MSEVDFPVHDIPDLQNTALVGRDDVMPEMHKFFSRDKRTRFPGPNCCVIHGIGGQGKAQTALEYTYREKDCYDVIIWLETEEEQELARSYSIIPNQ